MDQGIEPMQLPKRAPRLEWNLNTVIQIITLVTMACGGVALWVNRSRDVDELQSWKLSQTVHSDALEARVDKVEAQISNHEYRINLGEQSNANTVSSIKDVQSTLNQQSGDLKVVREILQRIEAAQKGGG
ncbi:hypothetical protein OE766_03560 [Pararhizobium sp. YC-54]|uniref:hypothetical protein n=1 Tax=Pararhizobium sp. YC-54 TaxID=2986920 RepID=UPI0021F72725|nr:hypothetical protein [Pararhizobium sp. YC-54]MCV9997314.1 hypothetical protein [Pararhizobium sp. YC-54]